ncbi:alpha-(1,3)-fucosyltransferase C-like [Melitaea cinxia]|uniref:alpha-(1,3)-fucosyltransferase C-like n=1 Tax=Melitaea cinxia TaxID=113334 RepID=UPI001E270379|nr:alpha-(1,3)-fucosyltransferase C-like [Melitaea cinxia]
MNSMRAERKDTHVSMAEMKYILQWTSRSSTPFNYMGEENSVFEKYQCKFRNCYVTGDKSYLPNQSEFDAIIFNGRDVTNLEPSKMPNVRKRKQKYIFAAMESSDNYPVCDEHYDGFFNWTWTYKVDSDFRWGYITVYNQNGGMVGPAVDVKWEREMNPISEELKLKLSSKTKAAAWFVSNCNSKSERELFVKKVQTELHQFGLSVDVYGECGTLRCPRSRTDLCFKKVENDYYFYFSMENSFAEDYVTEKLTTALLNYAVPVVYGGANYSRFLPPGSYLDAMALGPKELALQMKKIIDNQTLYHNFFRWRNHYVYKDTASKDICTLCEMLNDEEKVSQTTIWNDFRAWWNGARYKENCKM